MVLRIFGIAFACAGVAGCFGSAPTNPTPEHLRALGLVAGPPHELIEACRAVADQTTLTVYCPPVVPAGQVVAPLERQGNAHVYGDEIARSSQVARGYGMSLESPSLIARARTLHREDASQRRPPPDDFHAQHWVVFAVQPPNAIPEAVDNRVRYPDGTFESRARTETVAGIELTVLTGDIAGVGFASSDHSIVYWKHERVGYLVSVHYDHEATVAFEIAKALAEQMAACPPSGEDGSESGAPCELVFSGRTASGDR